MEHLYRQGWFSEFHLSFLSACVLMLVSACSGDDGDGAAAEDETGRTSTDVSAAPTDGSGPTGDDTANSQDTAVVDEGVEDTSSQGDTSAVADTAAAVDVAVAAEDAGVPQDAVSAGMDALIAADDSAIEKSACEECLESGGTWQPEANACTDNCDLMDISCYSTSCPEPCSFESCGTCHSSEECEKAGCTWHQEGSAMWCTFN